MASLVHSSPSFISKSLINLAFSSSSVFKLAILSLAMSKVEDIIKAYCFLLLKSE